MLLDSGRPEEASSTEAESISSDHGGERLANPGLVKYIQKGRAKVVQTLKVRRPGQVHIQGRVKVVRLWK